MAHAMDTDEVVAFLEALPARTGKLAIGPGRRSAPHRTDLVRPRPLDRRSGLPRRRPRLQHGRGHGQGAEPHPRPPRGAVRRRRHARRSPSSSSRGRRRSARTPTSSSTGPPSSVAATWAPTRPRTYGAPQRRAGRARGPAPSRPGSPAHGPVWPIDATDPAGTATAPVPALAEWDGTAWTGSTHYTVGRARSCRDRRGRSPSSASRGCGGWWSARRWSSPRPWSAALTGSGLWSWLSVVGYVAFMIGTVHGHGAVPARRADSRGLRSLTCIGIGGGLVGFGIAFGLESVVDHHFGARPPSCG